MRKANVYIMSRDMATRTWRHTKLLQSLAEAMPAYIEKHGHGWVPVSEKQPLNKDFLCPIGEAARKARKDIRLENRRIKKSRDKVLEKLLQTGFEPDYNDFSWQRFQTALLAYKKIHGDVHVPQLFIVPKDDAKYPSHVWGMRLGLTLNQIRRDGQYVKNKPGRRKYLDSIGFVWDVHQYKWDELIVPALLKYKSLYNDLLVPRAFLCMFSSFISFFY